jgi:hypothetical protein
LQLKEEVFHCPDYFGGWGGDVHAVPFCVHLLIS